MDSKAAVIEIIYRALRSLNKELDADKRVELAPDTRLFGPDASLDSLSLVSVIVDVESAVADDNGYPSFGSQSRTVERTGMRALIRSIGILGTCLKEAPEFGTRKRVRVKG